MLLASLLGCLGDQVMGVQEFGRNNNKSKILPMVHFVNLTFSEENQFRLFFLSAHPYNLLMTDSGDQHSINIELSFY